MEENINRSSESISSSELEVGVDLGPSSPISNLPWEVLQEIFYHIDGKSLLICKRVCKSWRDHVHVLEQKPNFWYNNCQKEIPSWSQFDLLDNMFPSHWKDQSQVDWEKIYKCWHAWNSMFETPVTIGKLCSGLNGISAVKVSGEWILISTCEGRGKLSAQKLTQPGGFIDLWMGGGAILNFELVNSNKNPFSNVKPPRELEEVFNKLEHNEIWLELKDSYKQLGRSYCYTLDRIQQRVSHSYGYEVRLVSKRNYSSVILKKTCSKIHGPELMEVELSNPYSEIINFWANTISLSAVRFDAQLNLSRVVDSVSINRRTQEASVTCSLDWIEDDDYETYSWHGSLFVFYNSKRRVMIHHGGKEKKQVTPVREGRVTSVLFYASYFFVGTERGKLLIYAVKSPEDCLTISVYETPSWGIKVCDGKIIHIAIAEPVHHKRKGPMIVCATPEDIYTVSVSV